MRRKLFLFLAALLGALLWMPAALATTGAPAAAGPSAVEIVAVLLAALALAAAAVLFVAMRRTNQEHERASAEMQRRLRELEAALARRRDEAAGADLGRRVQDLERDVDALDAALTAVERALPRSGAAQPTVTPQPTYGAAAYRPVAPVAPIASAQRPVAPVAPVAPAAPVPPPRSAAAAPRGAGARSEEQDLLAAMNRVLSGAESPDRAMQRAFPPAELARVELLHYVRPQRKLQDADYAEFCAYSRINPSNVAVMKTGKYVVPYRISLDAPALADWYDIDRRSDPENAAPHFVLQSLAIARESGETVQNEARESKRLLAVERKGRLVAYNL
ncbi:MAG TPA: hypothetical protein IAB43_10510 [Candidatus Spyradocola merdavium]|nr:hypothetical protein [Candidatus Spyradocola merdavium]